MNFKTLGAFLPDLSFAEKKKKMGETFAHKVISIESTIKILSSCCCAGDEDITSVDAASLKQAYAGLVTLILEAVKIDCDPSSIRYGLNSNNNE